MDKPTDLPQELLATYASPRVNDYVSTGDSCPELCMNYDVDIREFVVLACIKDADKANEDEICRLLGLSPTTVDLCIQSLSANGLIRASDTEPKHFQLTTDGISLLRKAAD